MEKRIAWEKFHPQYELIQPEESAEDEVESQEEETEWQDTKAEEEEDESEHITRTANVLDFLDLNSIVKTKIKTPFGYYDISDEFSPYNMFDCWIGHCNFRITHKDVDILDNQISGIGCLKVLSPYRFFIGIEKMFTFPTIRIQIQKDLCQNLDIENDIKYNNDADYVINMVLSKINDALFSIKESEKWAIFIGRSGEIETIKANDFSCDLEYEESLSDLKSMKNGNIIIYDSV